MHKGGAPAGMGRPIPPCRGLEYTPKNTAPAGPAMGLRGLCLIVKGFIGTRPGRIPSAWPLGVAYPF